MNKIQLDDNAGIAISKEVLKTFQLYSQYNNIYGYDQKKLYLQSEVNECCKKLCAQFKYDRVLYTGSPSSVIQQLFNKIPTLQVYDKQHPIVDQYYQDLPDNETSIVLICQVQSDTSEITSMKNISSKFQTYIYDSTQAIGKIDLPEQSSTNQAMFFGCHKIGGLFQSGFMFCSSEFLNTYIFSPKQLDQYLKKIQNQQSSNIIVDKFEYTQKEENFYKYNENSNSNSNSDSFTDSNEQMSEISESQDSVNEENVLYDHLIDQLIYTIGTFDIPGFFAGITAIESLIPSDLNENELQYNQLYQILESKPYVKNLCDNKIKQCYTSLTFQLEDKYCVKAFQQQMAKYNIIIGFKTACQYDSIGVLRYSYQYAQLREEDFDKISNTMDTIIESMNTQLEGGKKSQGLHNFLAQINNNKYWLKHHFVEAHDNPPRINNKYASMFQYDLLNQQVIINLIIPPHCLEHQQEINIIDAKKQHQKFNSEFQGIYIINRRLSKNLWINKIGNFDYQLSLENFIEKDIKIVLSQYVLYNIRNNRVQRLHIKMTDSPLTSYNIKIKDYPLTLQQNVQVKQCSFLITQMNLQILSKIKGNALSVELLLNLKKLYRKGETPIAQHIYGQYISTQFKDLYSCLASPLQAVAFMQQFIIEYPNIIIHRKYLLDDNISIDPNLTYQSFYNTKNSIQKLDSSITKILIQHIQPISNKQLLHIIRFLENNISQLQCIKLLLPTISLQNLFDNSYGTYQYFVNNNFVASQITIKVYNTWNHQFYEKEVIQLIYDVESQKESLKDVIKQIDINESFNEEELNDIDNFSEISNSQSISDDRLDYINSINIEQDFISRFPKINLYQNQINQLDNKHIYYYKHFLQSRMKKHIQLDLTETDQQIFKNIRESIYDTNNIDESVQLYQRNINKSISRALQRFKQIKRVLPNNMTFKYMCDIGSGDGIIAKIIAQELNIKELDIYEPYVQETEYQVTSETTINFIKEVFTEQTKKYDIITLLTTLHHITYPKDILTQIYNSLTNNGIFIMREHQPTNDQDKMLLDIMDKTYAFGITQENTYNLQELQNDYQCLINNDYEDIKYKPSSYFTKYDLAIILQQFQLIQQKKEFYTNDEQKNKNLYNMNGYVNYFSYKKNNQKKIIKKDKK